MNAVINYIVTFFLLMVLSAYAALARLDIIGLLQHVIVRGIDGVTYSMTTTAGNDV